MTDPTTKLLLDLRPIDAERVDAVFPAGLRSELFAKITSEIPTRARGRRSRPRRHPRPPTLGVIGIASTTTITAAAAILLATGSAVAPTPADAVSFRSSGNGAIIATVTDPYATRARLNAAFAKQGLHITINLFPVSPSAVGRVFYISVSNLHGPQIEPLREGDRCTSDNAECAIGLRIPKGFTATATIGLGRPARPGEPYESSSGAFAPGEPLHCSGLLGATVARALSLLERDKFTVRWTEDVETGTNRTGISSHTRSVGQPPKRDYIWGADMTSQGHIEVQIEPRPWPATPGAGAHFNDGC